MDGEGLAVDIGVATSHEKDHTTVVDDEFRV
jgi:hypothetical protein